MNIKEAKEQIKNTVISYLSQDEFGRYEISSNKQRPVFLMGPPGIGKTEIMSQIAAELGIGLISYSMTHHTRQSALGLPVIRQKEYDGVSYDVSEYTMSEIIASVYEMMEKTGLRKGLLFLDEINCVSETLNPIMLQFLQYKVFGGHKVPDGWIVVTAGNPPEYNNSVHEFDIVTWDRLKRIDIKPDFKVWKEYAYHAGVHSAIMTYLEIKPNNFYKIETTVDGKSFVTARGWDDLSRIIKQYEKHDIKVDRNVVSQYLQNDKIARDFAIYYDLYRKYKSDYQIMEILEGNADSSLLNRAKSANFDERYSLIGLLLEAVGEEAKNAVIKEMVLTSLQKILKKYKKDVAETEGSVLMRGIIESENNEFHRLSDSNSLSQEQNDVYSIKNKILLNCLDSVNSKPEKPFQAVKSVFDKEVKTYGKETESTKKHFSNMFNFCDEAFGAESQELLILVTELAVNSFTSRYISENGCMEYYTHDKNLMFHERNLEIIDGIESLKLNL